MLYVNRGMDGDGIHVASSLTIAASITAEGP